MTKETAKKCYECVSYISLLNKNWGVASNGICDRVGDCGGGSYAVLKNQTTCLFGNPDIKLSLDEIKLRDKKQAEKSRDFLDYIKKASEIVKTWPKWKQNLLNNIIPSPKKYIRSGAPQ